MQLEPHIVEAVDGDHRSRFLQAIEQRLRDTIYRQTLQLSTLVEDLLDVGRITAGKLRLDKKPIDLRDVAKQRGQVHA